MINEQKIPPLKHFKNPITIYHGTPDIIDVFRITKKSRDRVDFCKGIYFTTNREQAKVWSLHGDGVREGFVYETHLDYRLIQNGEIKLKEFLTYSDEFLDTFTYCRAYGSNPHTIQGYDVIYGLMIDSNKKKIDDTCEDYMLGKITKAEVRRTLQTLKASNQLCIKNNELLKNLVISNVYETTVIKGRMKIGDNIIWKK